ncbi:MAG: histidine phosphatase family protein [Gemmatimonadota bacterium]|nr:histidine phosphatase family protein [Gemmatimonadota bacterium]
MRILLVRHADAGRHDPTRWPDDTLRPLTDTGRRRHRRVARRLRRRGLVPTRLLSSPWLRAWESAEITSRGTRGPAPEACGALAESPELASLRRALGDCDEAAVVGFVGHEPWLSEFASLLLTGSLAELAIDFPKSGVMSIAAPGLHPGEGTLEFLWRPKGD